MPASLFSLGYGRSRQAGSPSSRAATAARSIGSSPHSKPACTCSPTSPRLSSPRICRGWEQQLVLADMMTGRHNTLVRLLQALRSDPEVFGDPVPGTGDEPGVVLSGVHYLRKVVAGLPNPRPAWYFDVAEQGEGLADTGVHLVDRVHKMLFHEQAL